MALAFACKGFVHCSVSTRSGHLIIDIQTFGFNLPVDWFSPIEKDDLDLAPNLSGSQIDFVGWCGAEPGSG